MYLINVTADQPVSENSTAQWRGEGGGVGEGRLSEDFRNIRTYALKYHNKH